MIDYSKELNDEQYKVVTAGDGPCLVLAGAGSGKTRAITYRVAYLLQQGVSCEEILLVTFTNKAAKEMLDRIGSLTGVERPIPWSGTFHHIGHRILRRYAGLLGYVSSFTILDSEDSRDLIKLCLKQEGIDRTEKRFPSAQVLQSIISFARNAETTIEDVLDRQHPKFLPIVETLRRIADDYAKRKKESNAMDFDDLLVNLYLLLLKEPRVKETFAQQFRHVLVDEYQDTNKIQASIIGQFAGHHRNILVVGDDAQSIYSFRAAQIANILEFEKVYPEAKTFRLETNYRSTPEILAVANDSISNNTKQYEKKLASVKEAFVKPEVFAFSDASEEAEVIVKRIKELQKEGIPLSSIAVLFRAAYHSQALELELTKKGIAYEYRGGMRFFERSHIKDVLAFLRIVGNMSDATAWRRVLGMQVGIGPTGVEKVVAALVRHPERSAAESRPASPDASLGGDSLVYTDDVTRENMSLNPGDPSTRSYDSLAQDDVRHFGSLLPARGQVGWSDFLSIWELLQKVTEKTPDALIRAILSSKYMDYLENEYPDYRDRKQDLEQLSVFAQKQPDLDQFLAEATLQESYRSEKTDDTHGEKKEQMVLSTIHQAKGLEWEAVFIINLAQGQFPVDRSFRVGDVEEERRLFYVAVTRAKRHLHLSYPLSGGYQSFLQGPSMFLEEIDRSLIDDSTADVDVFFSASQLKSQSIFNTSGEEGDITYEALDDDKPVREFLKSLDEL